MLIGPQGRSGNFGDKCKQDRQCTCNVTLRRVGRIVAALEKKLGIRATYSDFVSVALIIKHVKRMRRIVLPSVIWLAVLYFPTSSHKGHDFLKEVIEQKVLF